MPTQLVVPTTEFLPGYKDALRHGWFPDLDSGNMLCNKIHEQLSEIAADAHGFLAKLTVRGADTTPVSVLGRDYPRVPGFTRWIWDEDFVGCIDLRWITGTAQLPTYCRGHIGFSVVKWKRRRGYAKTALGLMLEQARTAASLPYVELVTTIRNDFSKRVILANRGRFIEDFDHFAELTGIASLVPDSTRFRIDLA
jgi:predicted acetyltransferase